MTLLLTPKISSMSTNLLQHFTLPTTNEPTTSSNYEAQSPPCHSNNRATLASCATTGGGINHTSTETTKPYLLPSGFFRSFLVNMFSTQPHIALAPYPDPECSEPQPQPNICGTFLKGQPAETDAHGTYLSAAAKDQPNLQQIQPFSLTRAPAESDCVTSPVNDYFLSPAGHGGCDSKSSNSNTVASYGFLLSRRRMSAQELSVVLSPSSF